MTLQIPRLPFALDPLIGEAKRRARQRRFLVATALLLAALAIALTLGLRPGGGGPSGGLAGAGTSVRVGALRLTVPRNLRRYSIRGGIYRKGTRPPVIGYVLADYRLKRGWKSTFVNWANFKVPPASRVALELTLWLGIGAAEVPARLHLPLSHDQPWFNEHTKSGARGYRVGFLRIHRQLYEVFYWSGGAAPPHDRAAVLNALSSIRLNH